MMKRILAVLLCLLCVISVLSACQSTETPPADTAAIDTSDDGADEEEKVVLPENMNYKGEDFYFLTAGNVAYHDFDVEEDTAGLNAVTEAQYKRLKYFEDKYGVKIIADRKHLGGSRRFGHIGGNGKRVADVHIICIRKRVKALYGIYLLYNVNVKGCA